MSRDEGFLIADISTTKHDDPKVKAMWRALAPDTAAMATAMALYEAVQLASWRQGERMTAEDAAPFWIPNPAESITSLVECELLGNDHRIPRKPWNSWFGTAKKRREQTRARWRRSKGPAESSTDIQEEPASIPRGTHAEPATPSSRPPVRPTEPKPRARGKSPTSIKEAMLRNGVKPEIVGGPA